MLTRQKIILELLTQSNRGLRQTPFVKLMFLLGEETALSKNISFYDFVPYRYGPFSFALFQEVNNLRKFGYLANDDNEIRLNWDLHNTVSDVVGTLPRQMKIAVLRIVEKYGKLDHNSLLKNVYDRYKWFTINSELSELKTNDLSPTEASVAIYTAGYERRSIDSFLNTFLIKGIKRIIDTRANPVSRTYGFAKSRLREISNKLGLEYCHEPELGIPSVYRQNLSTPDSYRRLLDHYETEILTRKAGDIFRVSRMMFNMPSVLICREGDEKRCHRSRLATAIARETKLGIVHL